MEIVHDNRRVKTAPCDFVINISSSKTRLTNFTREFNQGKKLRDPERLKVSVEHTLNRMILLLAKEYLRPVNNFYLQKHNATSPLNDTDLGLTCTKSYIAFLSQKEGQEDQKISTETIRKHIIKLEGWGLVKRMKIHSKLVVLIHPELLEFGSKFTHLRAHYEPFFNYSLESLINENRALQKQKNTNLGISDPYNETLNSKTVTTVEKVKGISSSDTETLKGISKSDKETTDKETLKAKNPEAADEKKKEKSCAKKEKKPRDLNRERYIEQTIIALWTWVYTHLYKDEYEYISASQKAHFETYIRNEFDTNPNTAVAVRSNLRTRLYVWHNWVKEVNGFTPLPSSFFIHRKQDGFDKTHSWLRSKKAREKEKSDRAYAKRQLRAFKHIQESIYNEDPDLDFHEKVEKQKKIMSEMRKVQKRNPRVYREFTEDVSNYLTGTSKTYKPAS